MKRMNLAILLMLAFLFSPWLQRAQSESPPPAAMDQVRQEAADGGYRLITAEELWERYHSGEDLLLVDTRQEWEYQAGHIEGAVNFPMEPTWLARQTKRAALASLLGSDKSGTIVFY